MCHFESFWPNGWKSRDDSRNLALQAIKFSLLSPLISELRRTTHYFLLAILYLTTTGLATRIRTFDWKTFSRAHFRKRNLWGNSWGLCFWNSALSTSWVLLNIFDEITRITPKDKQNSEVWPFLRSCEWKKLKNWGPKMIVRCEKFTTNLQYGFHISFDIWNSSGFRSFSKRNLATLAYRGEMSNFPELFSVLQAHNHSTPRDNVKSLYIHTHTPTHTSWHKHTQTHTHTHTNTRTHTLSLTLSLSSSFSHTHAHKLQT